MKKVMTILIMMLTTSLIISSCSSTPESDGKKAGKLIYKHNKLEAELHDFKQEKWDKGLESDEIEKLPEYNKLLKDSEEAKKADRDFYKKMGKKYTNEFDFDLFDYYYYEEERKYQ